jgi:hypothetical protein
MHNGYVCPIHRKSGRRNIKIKKKTKNECRREGEGEGKREGEKLDKREGNMRS